MLVEKYYLDTFFLWLAGIFKESLAKILFWFDWNVVIQKGVNGVAALTRGAGSIVRRAQTGRIQHYAMAFGFGVFFLVYFFILNP